LEEEEEEEAYDPDIMPAVTDRLRKADFERFKNITPKISMTINQVTNALEEKLLGR